MNIRRILSEYGSLAAFFEALKKERERKEAAEWKRQMDALRPVWMTNH